MSKIINPESSGKVRQQLCKAIVLALRELMRQTELNMESKDAAAFVAMTLLEIDNSIENTVAAWEKRGYWVKADRFRIQWEWTGITGKELQAALLEANWGLVAQLVARIGQKLNGIDVPLRSRLGKPWQGAWGKMLTKLEKKDGG